MAVKKYSNGAWTDINEPKIYEGGGWREAENIKRYANGAWQSVWENYPVKLETDNNKWTLTNPISYVKSTKDLLHVVGYVGYSRYDGDILEHGIMIPTGWDSPVSVSRFDCDYQFYGETKGITEDDGSVLNTVYTGDRMRFGVRYKRNGQYFTTYLCTGKRYDYSDKIGQGKLVFGGGPWILEDVQIVVDVYGTRYPGMVGTSVQGYFSNLRYNDGKKWRFPDFEKSGS